MEAWSALAPGAETQHSTVPSGYKTFQLPKLDPKALIDTPGLVRTPRPPRVQSLTGQKKNVSCSFPTHAYCRASAIRQMGKSKRGFRHRWNVEEIKHMLVESCG
jgi:hypothetical protein